MKKDVLLRAVIEKTVFAKIGVFVRKLWRYTINKISSGMFSICIFPMSRLIAIDNNKIIFITFRGEYDCNAKWIAETLHKRNSPYEIVWAIRENVPVEDIPASFTKVYRGSYEFYQQLSSAKIIVDNGISTIDLGYRKKRGQVLIETWHGSIGIKKFSEETNKDKKWCAKAVKEGNMTDYCISNSIFENNVYAGTFWGKSNILMLGHARNDILCLKDPEQLSLTREKVFNYFKLDNYIVESKNKRQRQLEIWYKEKTHQIPVTYEHLHQKNPFDSLDIMDDEKLCQYLQEEYAKLDDLRLCLYAPTFRDDGDIRPYLIDYEKLREALHIRFGGNWVILTRFHFRLMEKLKDYKLPAGIMNASNYSDIQELLSCVDVGITDYSSWICDYMLTHRPGFLFAADMDTYEQKDRAFFYPLSSMPFPLALNNDQLIANILNFDNEAFTTACDAFLKEKGCMDDGHASERIANFIATIISEQ